MATFDKYDDIIDSRDVIARIEELEAEREALQETLGDAREAYRATLESEGAAELDAVMAAKDALAAWGVDDGVELAALKALADEASGYAADWYDGETLIRDSYFTNYAMQLAEDIGAIDRNAQWPNTCIDWDQAARELQMDYTAVDFDGVTYWIR